MDSRPLLQFQLYCAHQAVHRGDSDLCKLHGAFRVNLVSPRSKSCDTSISISIRCCPYCSDTGLLLKSVSVVLCGAHPRVMFVISSVPSNSIACCPGSPAEMPVPRVILKRKSCVFPKTSHRIAGGCHFPQDLRGNVQYILRNAPFLPSIRLPDQVPEDIQFHGVMSLGWTHGCMIARSVTQNAPRAL